MLSNGNAFEGHRLDGGITWTWVELLKPLLTSAGNSKLTTPMMNGPGEKHLIAGSIAAKTVLVTSSAESEGQANHEDR
jgi:hypothetical protein